jgi:hypothetical protein
MEPRAPSHTLPVTAVTGNAANEGYRYRYGALNYLLTQFEEGSNNNDLRGQIMMALCKDLLGDSNNVMDESLSPQDWFLQLKPHMEIKSIR